MPHPSSNKNPKSLRLWFCRSSLLCCSLLVAPAQPDLGVVSHEETLLPCLRTIIHPRHSSAMTGSSVIAVCLYQPRLRPHPSVGGRPSKAALEETQQQAAASEANAPVRVQNTTTQHANAFTLRLVYYPTRKRGCRMVHSNGKGKGAGGSWDRARLWIQQYKRMPCMVQGQWRKWTWRMRKHVQTMTTVKTFR